MKTKVLLLATFILLGSGLWGQKKIETPIEGVYGQDYIIVNHVDWGLLDTIKDLHCGTKTYNGHQGTDFTIRNFKQMDSGVAVLAADTGIVTFIQDGLFDKETTSTLSKGLGNYIAIAHSGKFYSYYGHLKKNSLTVKVGDHVLPGQKIAEVGSSGNSVDPHLHFEWWYDSSVLIDPFSGPCGNNYTYWKNPAPYDTSFKVWMSGLTNDTLILDSLRYEPQDKSNFYPKYSDTFVSYWSLMYGLRKNDVLKIEWINGVNPSENVEYEIIVPRDYWYYYYWSYMKPLEHSITSPWAAVLRRNGKVVDQKRFELFYAGNKLIHKQDIQMHAVQHGMLVKNAANTEIILYSLNGKQIYRKGIPNNHFTLDLKSYKGFILVANIVREGQVIQQQKIKLN